MKPGVRPVEFKVLVKPDSIDKVTRGGIIIPPQRQVLDEMAQIRGIIVGIGGNAFEDWRDNPQVGDKVYFAKYAGYLIVGNDGEEYRMLNDKDICGIIEE